MGKKVEESDLRNKNWQVEHPWSAVFISYVIKKAGAGNAFRYSTLHTAYIDFAKQAYSAGDAARFGAYPITKAKPEIGDLVSNDRCKQRKDKKCVECHRTNYENVGDRNDKGHLYRNSHSDIVVDIDRKNNRIKVIGGNVNQSVDYKWISLRSDGRLPERTRDGCEYIAILKPPDDGRRVPVPATASPPGGSLFSALGDLARRFMDLVSGGEEVMAVTLAYQRGEKDAGPAHEPGLLRAQPGARHTPHRSEEGAPPRRPMDRNPGPARPPTVAAHQCRQLLAGGILRGAGGCTVVERG